jgi:hypothetical protein
MSNFQHRHHNEMSAWGKTIEFLLIIENVLYYQLPVLTGSATPHTTHLSSTDLSTVLSDPLLL